MSKNKSIALSVPEISGSEWRYVKESLDSGYVASGGFINEFEKKVASFLGARYAVACSSGTAALHISLLVSGVACGDEVIVPTLTFIAPVNAINYALAHPVFMDCDNYLNIDAEKVKEFIETKCRYRKNILINKKTKRIVKAILPVHVFGHPVNMESLMKISKRYQLKVIEDATESLGAYYISGKYKGKKTAAIGDLGCLSFNGNKIITAGGGGMIITDDYILAKKARYLTTQAKDDPLHYIHNSVGYNYRFANILAALGLAQLERINDFIEIKRRNFNLYNNNIKNIYGLRMIEEPKCSMSNYWFYSLFVDEKRFGISSQRLMKSFIKEKIEARPLWQLNHKQKPYRNCQVYSVQRAEYFSKRILNLPCSVGLSAEDIKRVIAVVKRNAKK